MSMNAAAVKLYRFFSSVKLAVFLFLTLAVASAAGTIIQQGLPIEKYEAFYNPRVFAILKFFDLFDMYHSWWFTLLLVLLSINIVVCTTKQIPRMIKLIFRGKVPIDDGIFASARIKKTFQSHRRLSYLEREAESLLKSLGSLRTKIEKDNKIYFVAEKGSWFRMGGILIHFSILFVLGGGLIGAICGFDGRMNIVEGETSDKIVLFNGNGSKKLDFDVRCDGFKVDYYDTGQPKEYRTDLTILKKGEEVISRSIMVNHPMFYDGLKFCQATYGIADAHNFQVVVCNIKSGEESILTLNMMEETPLPGSGSSFVLARFVPDYRGRGPAVVGVFLEPGKAHEIFLLVKNYQERMDDFTFRFMDFDRRYYTGIQVSRDPGVPVVWTGCILIMIGFALSLFLAPARVWLRISEAEGGYEVKVAANAGNGSRSLEEKMEKFTRRL